MKKTLFVLLAMPFLATAVKSQTLTFGPTVGYAHSWIDNMEGDRQFNSAPSVGLSFNYTSKSHIGFGADVKYSAEGGELDAKSMVGDVEFVTNSRINADYIRIPLKAIYSFGNRGDKIRPTLSAGPSLGLLVHGKTVTELTGGEKNEVETKDYFQKFDIGLQGTAGVNIKLSEKTWLNTDVAYYHGLKDATKNDNLDQKNRNIGVNFGLMFGL